MLRRWRVQVAVTILLPGQVAIHGGACCLSNMNPSRFLGLLFGSGLLFTAVAEPVSPNFVFAFADDWGRHASAYARLDGPGTVNDLLHTPHFDRLAREGVLFRRAFVSAPSCTPCRSALLSGQHFWRTGRGAILQGGVWETNQPAYPLLLQAAGYHLGKSYKVWSPGTPADAPYGGQAFAYEKHGRRINQSWSSNSKPGANWSGPSWSSVAITAHRGFRTGSATSTTLARGCRWRFAGAARWVGGWWMIWSA